MRYTSLVLLLPALLLAACGDEAMQNQTAQQSAIEDAASTAPSTIAYKKTAHKMHTTMMQTKYTGNADVDFARGMIPHHQGAVEMANTELQYGKDPEMRKLAKSIVSSQEKEIDRMQRWLKDHPVPK